MISKRTGAVLLVVLTVLIASAAALVPRVAQAPSYHHFADARTWFGISDFENVASNVLFLIFGAWGVWFLANHSGAKTFVAPRERRAYLIFFAGVLFTAIGSGYYHLMPDNPRLVWDRLPMTIVYWHFTEQRGAGDLRFYAAVQLYAIMVVLLMLFLPPRYTRSSDLVLVGAFYLVAKALEAADRPIYALGHAVSGHTLKHLAAAMSGYFVLHMLRHRLPFDYHAQASSAA